MHWNVVAKAALGDFAKPYDRIRLWTLLAFHYVEFDLVAFLQTLVSVNLDGTVVNEDVWTIVTANKAVSFGVIKPLHLAFVISHKPRTFLGADRGWGRNPTCLHKETHHAKKWLSSGKRSGSPGISLGATFTPILRTMPVVSAFCGGLRTNLGAQTFFSRVQHRGDQSFAVLDLPLINHFQNGRQRHQLNVDEFVLFRLSHSC
jgi:hypothetical protein